MKYMVPLEEAQKLLLQLVKPLEPVELELLQARGLVLAVDVPASGPVPPFSRSHFDGFALQSNDIAWASPESPARLLVTRSLKAGQFAPAGVDPGTAMAIVTGAPVPSGADCVVRFEVVRREGEDIVLSAPLKPGQGIMPAGGDVAARRLGSWRPSATAGSMYTGGPGLPSLRRATSCRPLDSLWTAGKYTTVIYTLWPPSRRKPAWRRSC